jgi:hypothetical protein
MTTCEHLEFACRVAVSRLSTTEEGPVTGYSADVTVRCAVCGLPFAWLGLPIGLSPKEPRTSFDGLELRAPIIPSDFYQPGVKR